MSRHYRMEVTITNYDSSKEEDIRDAADNEWNWDDWSHYGHNNRFVASGESNLCGGESEKEFADRLTRAIWEANGSFCNVEVEAVYLEDPPTQTYSFDEYDYEKMMSGTCGS